MGGILKLETWNLEPGTVSKEETMPIDQELLDILACPKCKGTIQPENGGSSLVCHSCKLRYRVEDDIPVMLIDEAEEI